MGTQQKKANPIKNRARTQIMYKHCEQLQWKSDVAEICSKLFSRISIQHYVHRTTPLPLHASHPSGCFPLQATILID